MAAPSTSSTDSPASSRRPGLLVEAGRVEYGRTLDFQRRLCSLRRSGEIPDTLLLLEHPPTITIGRNAGRSNLLCSDEELARRGISLFHVERGGDITFHGPGQLVGYFIYALRSGLVGVRGFVERLEQGLARGIAELGVGAEVRPGLIGVWCEDRKIASIGVAVGRGITFHGFALNVSTDLSFFDLMNPCGLSGVRMTSVQAEGGKTDHQVVKDAVVSGLEMSFGVGFQKNLPRSLASLTNGLS